MEQEERCLPSVFGSRELNKEEEQEKGKWLLWCLHLPLFSPPKRNRFDFPEAAPKEFAQHSKEKASFFPPTDLAEKPASHSTRGKNPILLVRAHYCQTD